MPTLLCSVHYNFKTTLSDPFMTPCYHIQPLFTTLHVAQLSVSVCLYNASSSCLPTPAGSIEEILATITNQYYGNGLQQGASLTINAMLQAELKKNPVLLWMNGDVNYARSTCL